MGDLSSERVEHERELSETKASHLRARGLTIAQG